jgi:alpha-tubulin suppressor-like RCC1 family protein
LTFIVYRLPISYINVIIIMSSRRSARNRKEIVAPGFGTASDVQRLSQDLGGTLPVTAVTAMMRSEGRGIRGKSDTSGAQPGTTNPPSASPQTSNAWADFIQEEGVGGADVLQVDAKKEPEDESSNKRRKTEDTASTSASTSTSASASTRPAKTTTASATLDDHDDGTLDYDLSVLSCQEDLPFGSLVQSGTLDTTIIGRKNLKSTETAVYHLNVPTVLLPKIAITQVFTSCNAAHAIALDKSNQAYGWGRNEGLCLGSSMGEETTTIPTPQIVASNIQTAALGKFHTIFLQTDGSLHALGTNKVGQCGWKQNVKSSGVLKACVASKNTTFAKISCGEDFSVALDDQGILYTSGSSEFGQMANGETGEYFVCANKLAYTNSFGFAAQTIFHHDHPSLPKKTVPLAQDIRLQDIACGKHHAVALEAPNKNNPTTRIFTWGCGDYGCLGHNRQHDEYYPRQVEGFQKGMTGTKVAAGGHCTLVLTTQGHVYFWGVTKSNDNATMKPQLVDALANNQHIVTQIGAGPANVACSTDLGNTVVWGQGPYGELGLGTRKSSAKPAFVDSISGIKVSGLACGLGSILYVVQEDKDLPKVDLEAVEQALTK